MANDSFKFQVNLGGMIELLSDHLYSSPDVYIRELLQNGVDAITAREQLDDAYKRGKKGTLTLTLEEGQSIIFTDNGVGLTEQEIHSFLSIIGESSKRDLETGKILNEYIGRFGIGLLSCFMVTDSITVKTRSAKDGAAHIWVGKPDGTYTIEALAEDIPVGTQLHLHCKKGREEFYSKEKIQELVRYYGLILPYPVVLICDGQKERLNPEVLPWEKPFTHSEEILAFGRELFDIDFLDFTLIHSDEGNISGVAFILPYSVSATTKQKHRIFLKNMLLTEAPGDLIPEWAVFTKCILNARDLRPTASRESFYEDDSLRTARDNISQCLFEYIREIAKYNEPVFTSFMYLHQLAVKSVASENEELYREFIDYFTFHSTAGEITGRTIKQCGQVLYCSHEKYRQLAQVFTAQKRLLVDIGYVYDYALLTAMPEYFDVSVLPVVEDEIGSLLTDVSPREKEKANALIAMAKEWLAEYGCNVDIKRFMPSTVPCFYTLNEAKEMVDQIHSIEEDEDFSLFDEMLGEFREELEETASATLFLNADNPVIERMMALANETASPSERKKIQRILCILYVQTLLIGSFPLRNNELGLLNENLLGMIGELL